MSLLKLTKTIFIIKLISKPVPFILVYCYSFSSSLTVAYSFVLSIKVHLPIVF